MSIRHCTPSKEEIALLPEFGRLGLDRIALVATLAQAREALVQKAKNAAEKVRRWGDAVELEPLNAFDRRIVHQALKDDPDVETHSVEVEGSDKKAILLRPKH